MNREKFDFSFSDLKIDIQHIENVIGYDREDNRKMVQDIIAEVLESAARICEIKGEYVVIPGVTFDSDIKTMHAGGVDFNIGKIIWGQIRKSSAAAFFVCTAGPQIGELSRKLMTDKDFLKGYIYDIAGSEIVEAAADLLQEALKKRMENENLRITNRFSPGYCGWNVSEQHKLFTLIPGNYCGIELTQSALMNPIKSVSGVVGIGDNVKFQPYTCNICDDLNCIYRRTKTWKE